MAILLHQRFQLKKSCPNLCTAAVKYELLILFLINAPISPYSPPLCPSCLTQFQRISVSSFSTSLEIQHLTGKVALELPQFKKNSMQAFCSFYPKANF